MEAKVTWHEGLSFTGAAESGFQVALGSDPAVGGKNDGFRPMELIAVGLAGCTAMDVISILTKKRQAVVDFEVQVHAERAAEHPKVFTRSVIEYFVTGHNLDEAALVRALELSATRYCPAQAMLGQVMPIELKYNLFEGASADERSLVKRGVYVANVGTAQG
jgi:putative redox protein